MNKMLFVMMLGLSSASSAFAMWFTPGCNQNVQKRLLTEIASQNPQAVRQNIASTQLKICNQSLSRAQREWQSSLKLEETARSTKQSMLLQMNMKIGSRIDELRVEEAQKGVQCWNDILTEFDRRFGAETGFNSEEERGQAITKFIDYANQKTNNMHISINGINRNINKLTSVIAATHTSNEQEVTAAVQRMEQALATVGGTVANDNKPAAVEFENKTNALNADNNRPNGNEDEIKGHQVPFSQQQEKASTMHMDNPDELSLRQWRDGESDPLKLRMRLDRAMHRGNDVYCAKASLSLAKDALQDAQDKPVEQRILLELDVHEKQLQVDWAQREYDCNKRIFDLLDGREKNPNYYNLFSDSLVVREQARVELNQFAAEETNRMKNDLNEIQIKSNRLNAARNLNNVQAQKEIIEKVTGRPALVDNITRPNTNMKSFFANNRNYIVGAAITGAVVGTIYFYGHRIKTWLTGKPAQENTAAEVVNG